MFGTLRQSHSINGPYSLEQTVAPFGQHRQGQITRNACIRCRMRKAKCTGEEGGCQRCRNKNVDCRYPVTQNSRIRIEGKTTTSRHQPAKADAQLPFDDTVSLPASSSSQPDSIAEGCGPVAMNAPSTTATKSTPATSHASMGNDVDFSLESMLQFSKDMEQSPGVLPLDTSVADLTNDHWLPMDEPDLMNTMSNHTDYSDAGIAKVIEPQCSCFIQVIRTHEMVEIDLVNGLQESTPAPIILQKHKRCLAECERLLGCPTCSKKSEFVMLILSMCDKITYSMEDILSIMIESQQDESYSYDTLNQSHERLYVATLHPSHVANFGHCTEGTGYQSDYRNTEQLDQGSQRGLHLGQWQLDEDDQIHVLRSLFSARLIKLDQLLATLQNLTDTHGWPTHRKLVQDLRKRYKESFPI